MHNVLIVYIKHYLFNVVQCTYYVLIDAKDLLETRQHQRVRKLINH